MTERRFTEVAVVGREGPEATNARTLDCPAILRELDVLSDLSLEELVNAVWLDVSLGVEQRLDRARLLRREGIIDTRAEHLAKETRLVPDFAGGASEWNPSLARCDDVDADGSGELLVGLP